MSSTDSGNGGARLSLRCVECGSPLAVDQRYCLECGRRAVALPPNVAAYIEAIAWRHRRLAVELDDASGAPDSGLASVLPFGMPSPRAAAVAVLGTLAFGTLLGTGNASIASAPIILALQGAASVAAAAVNPPAASAPAATPPASTSGSAPSAAASNSAPATPVSTATTPAATATTSSTSTTGAGTGSGLPPVKHVFVILLADQGYASTFSPLSKDRYLAKTLVSQGEIVPSYYGVAQGELANEIALISGQGPTVQTSANCPTFSAITPGKLGSDGQVLGDGCVYPRQTPTLPGQFAAAHLTWKAYIEGLGPKPAKARDARLDSRRDRETLTAEPPGEHAHRRARSTPAPPISCRHPNLGAPDTEQAVSSSDAYVTWRNPFVYFRSLTASRACQTEDVGLSQLATDLRSDSATPALSFIMPGPCDDGSSTPCRPNAPAGTAESDKFLKTVVPEILASPAYKDEGILFITFDQAPQSGPDADAGSCCENPTYPNLPSSTSTTTSSSSSGSGDTTTSTSGSTDTTSSTASGSADTTTTSNGSSPTTSTSGSTDTTSSTASGSANTTTTSNGSSPTTSTSGSTDTTSSTASGSAGTTTSTGSSFATTTAGETAGTGSGTSGSTSDTSDTPSTSSSGTSTSSTSTSTSSTLPGLLPGETAGGGQVGLLVLSSYVEPKSSDVADEGNHFSLLLLIENLFSFKTLGYTDSAEPFTTTGLNSLFNNYSG